MEKPSNPSGVSQDISIPDALSTICDSTVSILGCLSDLRPNWILLNFSPRSSKDVDCLFA